MPAGVTNPGFLAARVTAPAWQRGQSGNVRGANKGYRRVLKAAREASPEAMQKAIQCMRDDTAEWSARLRAIEIILDRAWGTEGKINLDLERVTNLTITIERSQHAPEPVTIEQAPQEQQLTIETVRDV